MNEICYFLGGSSVDTILEVPRMPLPDEKLVARLAGVQAGGLVSNTACAAALLGLPSAWAGVLGDDADGRLVLSEFARFGVDTAHTHILPGARTDFCVILLDASRERSILVVPTTQPAPVLTDELLQALSQARLAYLIPQRQEIYAQISQAVHSGGGLLAVDVEVGEPLPPEEMAFCLSHSDVIFTNRSALLRHSGESDPGAGARKWLDMGAHVVVVTMGAEGAAAYTWDESCQRPGYHVPVLDTTGAGDSFHAAFLFGMLSGWPLAGTLEFSNAAAALSVQKLGARPGLPTLAEVRAFLDGQRPAD